ncbi:hypothetical protein [Streptomyces marincola]|uniref:hypothetical protein n=1 Tax=Streptomyces marincola TaxID=2878388 RepID=UPI00131CCEAD|nr:hypothetical protein [Streptomyces marincola]
MELLETLSTDANYSAQTYFEAAKSADFWSRVIVFFPALVSAAAGMVTAFYSVRIGGPISAISGAIAATASFIGSGKQAGFYRDSARKYTNLRHAVRLEISLAGAKTEAEMEEITRALFERRQSIVSTDEPVPNRFFDRASSRISAGVTSYNQSGGT